MRRHPSFQLLEPAGRDFEARARFAPGKNHEEPLSVRSHVVRWIAISVRAIDSGLSSPEGLSLSAAELTAHHSPCPLSTRAIIDPPEGYCQVESSQGAHVTSVRKLGSCGI